MKKQTLPEFCGVVFMLFVMMVASAIDAWTNSRKGAWGSFAMSVVSIMFFAAILGYLLVDAFNRRQRRKRESACSLGRKAYH